VLVPLSDSGLDRADLETALSDTRRLVKAKRIGSNPLDTMTLVNAAVDVRRPKVQPLPTDVADALRVYLDGKPSNVPVWGGTWARDHRGADMLRIDLDAAGIEYATEGPDGPVYADFHSLRHSYLILGGWSGIDLRTLQELAEARADAL